MFIHGCLAQTQSTDPNAITAVVLKVLDSSQNVLMGANNCIVEVTTDKDALIQDVDRLRTTGVLNDSFDDQYYEDRPAILILTISLQSSSAAAEGFFQSNHEPDLCHFKQSMSYTDSYGNTQTELLYSFDFDRDTYNKINWDKFIAANMTKVSKHFVTTPIMDAMMQLAIEQNTRN